MALDTKKAGEVVDKLRKSLKRKSRWSAPEDVHDLRTQVRQFEALTHILALGQKSSEDRLKTIASIRRRAGKVRDMDVLMAFIATLTSHSQEDCFVQLRDHLAVRRRRSARRLRDLVREHGKKAGRDLQRYSSMVQKASQTHATSVALKLLDELRHWPRLASGNMHEFRLKVKQLRYTLQLEEHPPETWISALGEIKDAIGEWHDCTTLLEIATDVLPASKGAPILKEIRSVVAVKFHHALSLSNAMRKRFLSKPSKRSAAVTEHGEASEEGDPLAYELNAVVALAGQPHAHSGPLQLSL